jgi:hypothetical protein
MKKGIGRLSLLVLMVMMAVSLLTGCGPKKPAPEEAQAYVKAVLDLMCTGEYDNAVNLADIEEGKEAEVRDNLIDEMMSGISSQSNLNEDVAKDFRDFMIGALEKAKYTVGDAVAADDGGYDVTVSVEPLQLFTGIEDELNSVLEERVAAESDKILGMSEEEQTNYVMSIVIELLNKKIADPQYDPAEEVVVHYGPMEGQKGVYGCTEAEGEKLGSKLFSTSGL